MTRCCSHIKVNVKDENRKMVKVVEPQFWTRKHSETRIHCLAADLSIPARKGGRRFPERREFRQDLYFSPNHWVSQM